MLKKLCLLVFLLVVSTFYIASLTTKNARKSLVEYLELEHKGKYEIVVFESSFNPRNLSLFSVQLRLVEAKKILIAFEWDAKLKKLHTPCYQKED